MKLVLVTFAGAALFAVGTAHAALDNAAAEAMMKKDGCAACHALEVTLGPFVEKDERLSRTIALPHGIGKSVRVAVFSSAGAIDRGVETSGAIAGAGYFVGNDLIGDIRLFRKQLALLNNVLQ